MNGYHYQMRSLRLAAVLCMAPVAAAAAQRLTSADSALVARLLLAEDRRDTTRAAYADGLAHADARIRTIAQRGLGRSLDPIFARRDSLPPLPAPPTYEEAAWRLRFRALGNKNDDCAKLGSAMGDSAWAVRLRAADLVSSSCAADPMIRGLLASWRAGLPARATRKAGGVAWHAAAHAIVAIARVAPADARRDLSRFALSRIPYVRVYAARAAALVGDTTTLFNLAGDADDNVAETAIAGLARVSGHASDDAYLTALATGRKPVVRAAAAALKGSPRGPAVLSAAIAAAERLRRDSSETSRRVRAAAAERVAEFATAADWNRVAPLTADFDCAIARAYANVGTKLGVADAAPRCTPMPITLPPDAVRLALGAPVTLRVTMAASSGGGSFTVRLRGDNAPVMAARVLHLAKAGWYDGNEWHRVEPDFVTQGGAPGANEFHGHPRFMRDELGTVPHLRGTIGMSTGEHDTGDGQWFFNLRDNLRLNRDYTVFAEVTKGIEVVDGILEGDVIAKIEVIGR